MLLHQLAEVVGHGSWGPNLPHCGLSTMVLHDVCLCASTSMQEKKAPVWRFGEVVAVFVHSGWRHRYAKKRKENRTAPSRRPSFRPSSSSSWQARGQARMPNPSTLASISVRLSCTLSRRVVGRCRTAAKYLRGMCGARNPHRLCLIRRSPRLKSRNRLINSTNMYLVGSRIERRPPLSHSNLSLNA